MATITYDEEPTISPKITYEERRVAAEPTLGQVAKNAAYGGVSDIPDMFLNLPNTLMNLGKAGVGTVAGLSGRPDLMPSLTPNPDFTRRGMESIGAIDPNVIPQGAFQKAIDYGTRGLVSGALTGGSSLPRTIAGGGAGALSGISSGGVMEATGNPALAATAGMFPSVSGLRPSGVTPSRQSGNPVKDATFAKGQAEGYVAPPSTMNPTTVAKKVESLGGTADTTRKAAISNQEVTNKISGREAGLSAGEPITEASLTAAREPMYAPYKEVASINPMANKALEALKQTRADSKLEWTHYERQGDPAALKRAQELDSKADMYETVLERIASRSGKPELIDKLREARVNIAKNYTVYNALNLGNGNVDASIIGRMYDKNPARFKDSGFETIAKFQQSFPSSMTETSKVQAPGRSRIEGWGALGLGLAGHAFLPGGYGALAALPIAAAPAARAFALSPYMQGGRAYGPGILSNSATVASPVATQGILAELYRNQGQQ